MELRLKISALIPFSEADVRACVVEDKYNLIMGIGIIQNKTN